MATPCPIVHDRAMKLPSSPLCRAVSVGQSRALSFDWPGPWEVALKVEEEWKELQKEIEGGDRKKIKEEFGDLLFTLVQLARHLKIGPDEALEAANEKFLRRFQKMCRLIERDSLSLSSLSDKEKELYWKKVKTQE